MGGSSAKCVSCETCLTKSEMCPVCNLKKDCTADKFKTEKQEVVPIGNATKQGHKHESWKLRGFLLNKTTRTLYYRNASKELKNSWPLPEGTLVSSYDDHDSNRPLNNGDTSGIEIALPQRHAQANGGRQFLHLSFSDRAVRDTFYSTFECAASCLGVTFSDQDDTVNVIDPAKIVKCYLCGKDEDLEHRRVCTALHDKYIKDGEQFFKNSKLQYFEKSNFVHFRTETGEIFSVPRLRVEIQSAAKRKTKKVTIDLFSEKKTFNMKKMQGEEPSVAVSKPLKRILKNRYGKKAPTVSVTAPRPAAGACASPRVNLNRRLATMSTVTQLPAPSCTEPPMSPTILYTGIASVGFVLGGFLIYRCLRRARQPKRDSFGFLPDSRRDSLTLAEKIA